MSGRGAGDGAGGPGSVFDDLVGQAPLIEQLQHTAAHPEAMTHAWLFTGPPGSGRSKAARAFAAALQCEGAGAPGCGQCQACRTILAGSHADLIVEATAETFIRVGRARELALAAGSRPTVGRWRVIIIEDADRLNDQAADALLKSLEEPPPRTVWMLCAPSLEDILVTIRSRCRHMRLRTPPVDDVAELLQRRDGIDAAMAHYAARAAQSHVGIARRLALHEDSRNRRRRVTTIPLGLTHLGAALAAAEDLHISALDGSSGTAGAEADEARATLLRQLGADPSARTQPPAIRAHLKEFEERTKRLARRQQHDTIDAALTDLTSVYRDALVIGTGAGIDAINSTEIAALRDLARAFTAVQLLQALDTIGLARPRLIANGSPLLVLEAMMVALILPKAIQGV